MLIDIIFGYRWSFNTPSRTDKLKVYMPFEIKILKERNLCVFPLARKVINLLQIIKLKSIAF